MKKYIAALALALAVGTPAVALADGNVMPTPKSGLYLPCEYEDSNNCVWDARHLGNGHGRSFIATKRGKVIYIPHRAAHRLQEPGVY